MHVGELTRLESRELKKPAARAEPEKPVAPPPRPCGCPEELLFVHVYVWEFVQNICCVFACKEFTRLARD